VRTTGGHHSCNTNISSDNSFRATLIRDPPWRSASFSAIGPHLLQAKTPKRSSTNKSCLFRAPNLGPPYVCMKLTPAFPGGSLWATPCWLAYTKGCLLDARWSARCMRLRAAWVICVVVGGVGRGRHGVWEDGVQEASGWAAVE